MSFGGWYYRLIEVAIDPDTFHHFRRSGYLDKGSDPIARQRRDQEDRHDADPAITGISCNGCNRTKR